MERTTQQPQTFNILCLDPSLTAFGYAVIEGNTIIDTGVIKTVPSSKKLRIRKGDDRCRRITEINVVLLAVIQKYKIAFIVSEQPHGSQSAVAATALGIVLALIQTISNCLDIGVDWYSEADAKKCALGKQSATKKEMIDRISELYKVPWTGTKYKDEAIADAIAIHYVASKYSNVLKAMKK